MNRAALICCALAAALSVWIARDACAAGSMWTAGSRSLVGDRRAARCGDIITILVVEKSAASHQAAHQTDKKLSAGGGPGGGVLGFFPELSVTADRSTSGSGSSMQTTTLVDRISGVVTAVTPQGNLQIQAVRHVKINKDELTLTVTGLVRGDDVSPDNIVLSTQVADCHLEWSGRGAIPEKQRPGLLSSVLSWLW
jgi:flagellar L-ring protein precursor FlgH